MRKMVKAVCCDKCFQTIAERDTNSARQWLDLCSVFAITFDIMKMSTDSTGLRNLENMKFIETHEIDRGHILVKMKGHFIDEDNVSYFCIDTEGHGD